jgi:two-component system chemotaxis response regulator CheB
MPGLRRELIRVLVIDDSAYSRQMIARMLRSSPLVEVVGTACDGEEALRKALELEPDLVTLDLEMPRMDGFTLLRLLMAKRPTPVIVVSGRTGEEDVFKALELGAADFIAKPSPNATPELENIQDELIRKVHAIRELRIDKLRGRVQAVPPPVLRAKAEVQSEDPRIVVVGSSTGGPAALMEVLGAFTVAPNCSFLVAQHMPAGFTRGFAERIDRLTPFEAREARGGETLDRGCVLIAPGGHHLVIERSGGRLVTRVFPEERGDRYSPSVDRLFCSAAKHLGSELLAVVLTGMGDDGRAGVVPVREAGGTVIAESEETAVIFGMPRRAIQTGAVDWIMPLGDIPKAILSGVGANGAPSHPTHGKEEE